jgi:uncharacterized protein
MAFALRRQGAPMNNALRVGLWMVLTAVVAAQALPKPTGRINDFAGVIDAATEIELDRLLDQLEQKTSSEIAVATVTSLGGMSVEEYANRLFKEWGIGRAKQDNGVLVLVAPNDREMRIEVGYGLEGVLPDGLAGQIIDDDFTPWFRDGDYTGGIRNGVGRVAEVVQRQQVLTAEEIAKLNESPTGNVPLFIAIPFFGLFITIGFGMLGIGLRSKTGFPVLFGSLFGGLPLLMSLAFMGKLSLYTLIPYALVMFIYGLRLGGRPAWRDAFRDSGGKGGSGSGRSSGWTMGSSSRSGSSSSSRSSSSSSFGGGSSGGGGASGKW